MFFFFFASFLSFHVVSYKDWREPLTDKAEDIAAAHYLVEGGLGWSLGCAMLRCCAAWPRDDNRCEVHVYLMGAQCH